MYGFFKKRIWLWLLLFGVVACLFSVFFLARYNRWTYDLLNDNPSVKSLPLAKEILDQYPTVKFMDLPAEIKQPFYKTNYNLQNNISSSKFYLIPRKDLFKKIFLDIRINELVTKEQQIQGVWYFQKKQTYLCIDENLIASLFLLQEKLVQIDCDPSALIINSGYRSPNHNQSVGGSPMSQHLFGKAIDLKIGDINQDGRVSQEDKQIVYKILNTDIIANKGGLGFYPNTQILHMDVRGEHARWNYYNRKK